MCLYVFNGIQLASLVFLTPKRKIPSAAADLYRFFIGSRGKTAPQDKKKRFYVTHIDFINKFPPQDNNSLFMRQPIFCLEFKYDHAKLNTTTGTILYFRPPQHANWLCPVREKGTKCFQENSHSLILLYL